MTDGSHVDDLLSAYMDGELDTAMRAHVEAHLHACARCGQELESWRGLHAQLRDAAVPDPGAAYWSSFATRVHERLPASTASGRAPWVERLAGWFAPSEHIAWRRVAGAFAIVTLVTYVGMRGFEPDRVQGIKPAAESVPSLSAPPASPSPKQAETPAVGPEPPATEGLDPPRPAPITASLGAVSDHEPGDTGDHVTGEKRPGPASAERAAAGARRATQAEGAEREPGRRTLQPSTQAMPEAALEPNAAATQPVEASATTSAISKRLVADEAAKMERPTAGAMPPASGTALHRVSTPGVSSGDAAVRTFVAAALAGDTLTARSMRDAVAGRDAAAAELRQMDAWLQPAPLPPASSARRATTGDASSSSLAALDALVWPRREQPGLRPHVEELARRLTQHAADAPLRARAVAYVEWLAATAPDAAARAAWQAELEALRP